MRSFVVASLTALVLVCSASASARGWRDLRIDASSDSSFAESVQQMRDELPYHHALFFVLTLKDLKARFSPAEYRRQLDGLSYRQIARLASPNVTAAYLASYTGRPVAQPFGTHDSSEGVAATVSSGLLQ
jgi:hypothetical protein